MVAFPGLGSITQDLWALPPRGLTTARFKIGPDDHLQWTYLCEVNGCFAMATSTTSEQAARDYVKPHICPAPPRRGISATGKSLMERMWDESDDALDAYKAGTDYLSMEGNLLRGYIHGIAECISFCGTPYFRIVEDVLRQMQRRWRMRQGEIPFSPTPGYRFNPRPSSSNFPAHQAVEDHHEPNSPAVVGPVVEPSRSRKTAPKEVSTQTRDFASAEVEMISTAYHSGTSTAEDLAKMFGVSAGRIVSVAGPSPSNTSSEVGDFLGGLFG